LEINELYTIQQVNADTLFTDEISQYQDWITILGKRRLGLWLDNSRYTEKRRVKEKE
jgi:hypothetical protein